MPAANFSFEDLFVNPWGNHNPLAIFGCDRQLAIELRRRPENFDEVVRRMFRLRMIVFHPDKSSANESYAQQINTAKEFLDDPFLRDEIIDEFLRQTASDHRRVLVGVKTSFDEIQQRVTKLEAENERLRQRLSETTIQLRELQQREAIARVAQQGFWIASTLVQNEQEQPDNGSTAALLPAFAIVHGKKDALLYIDSDRCIYTLFTYVSVVMNRLAALDRYLRAIVKTIIADQRDRLQELRKCEIREVTAAVRYATIILEAEQQVRDQVASYAVEVLEKRNYKRLQLLRTRRWPVDKLLTEQDTVVEKRIIVQHFVDRMIYMATKDFSLQAAAKKRDPIEKVFRNLLGYELTATFSRLKKDAWRTIPLPYTSNQAIRMTSREFTTLIIDQCKGNSRLQMQRYLGTLHPSNIPTAFVENQLQMISPDDVALALPGLLPQLNVGHRIVTSGRANQVNGELRVSVAVANMSLGAVWMEAQALTRAATHQKSLQLVYDQAKEVNS